MLMIKIHELAGNFRILIFNFCFCSRQAGFIIWNLDLETRDATDIFTLNVCAKSIYLLIGYLYVPYSHEKNNLVNESVRQFCTGTAQAGEGQTGDRVILR